MSGGTFFPLVVAVIAAGLLLVAFGEVGILVPMVLALGVVVVGLAGKSGH